MVYDVKENEKKKIITETVCVKDRFNNNLVHDVIINKILLSRTFTLSSRERKLSIGTDGSLHKELFHYQLITFHEEWCWIWWNIMESSSSRRVDLRWQTSHKFEAPHWRPVLRKEIEKKLWKRDTKHTTLKLFDICKYYDLKLYFFLSNYHLLIGKWIHLLHMTNGTWKQ